MNNSKTYNMLSSDILTDLCSYIDFFTLRYFTNNMYKYFGLTKIKSKDLQHYYASNFVFIKYDVPKINIVDYADEFCDYYGYNPKMSYFVKLIFINNLNIYDFIKADFYTIKHRKLLNAVTYLPNFKPWYHNKYPIFLSIYYGPFEIVKKMLSIPNMGNKINDGYIIKMLLNCPNFHGVSYLSITYIINIIKCLITNQKIKIYYRNIIDSLKIHNIPLFKLLLTESKIDIKNKYFNLIKKIISDSTLDVLKYFISTYKLNSPKYIDYALILACKNCYSNIVTELTDKYNYSQRVINIMIGISATAGYIKIINTLIKTKKVTPITTKEYISIITKNNAFQKSNSVSNIFRATEILLKEKMFQPKINISEIIDVLLNNNNTTLVNLLK